MKSLDFAFRHGMDRNHRFTVTLPQGRFAVPRNGGRTFHVSLTPARRRAAR